MAARRGKQPPQLLRGEQLTVAVDELRPNRWNPNVQSDFKYEKEKESIREFGFIDPVTVREGAKKGKPFGFYEIIDGEHRWKAAKDLGMTEVLVLNIGFLSDAKAKILTDVLNNLRGENDRIKWADMVRSVKDVEPELLNLLPYTRAEVDDMLESARFNWDSLSSDDPQRNDTLFKKLTIGLTEEQMELWKDVLRKVKAAHKIDDDAKAFELVLLNYKSSQSTATTAAKPNGKAKARARANAKRAPKKKRTRARAEVPAE